MVNMLEGMLKKVNVRRTLIASLAASLLFAISVIFYIHFNTYRQTWLLYLGSFLFFVVIWIHTIRESKLRTQSESTVALAFVSHVATLSGIFLSCIWCFIILSLMVKGYLHSGNAAHPMTDEPANVIKDKTDGLSFQVFFAATIINFSVGSFTGIVLPFYTKRNQTRDNEAPTPLHQYDRQ
jgi:hypothetical protein